MVRVFGTDLATLDERELLAHRRRIGYLFQDGALLNWLNLEDNVALPLREHGEGSPKEILEKVHSTLDMVELANIATRSRMKSRGECESEPASRVRS